MKMSSSLEVLESRIAPAIIIGLDSNNRLISFDSATPDNVTIIQVTGLANAGETLEAIDFRPATGQLYGLGITDTPGDDEGRIYIINPATGVATQVGNTPFSTTLIQGADWGFDFNPVADRIRLVNDSEQNFRINPNTGALAATDTNLPAGSIVGAGYTNSFAGAQTTTLYGIDYISDSLVRIGGIDGIPSPNGGAVTQVGPLGVDVTSFRAGLDIDARTGIAYAVLRTSPGVSQLYTVDLATGAASLIGTIGTGGDSFHSIAIVPPNDLTLVNDKTARYVDQDGDIVTVTVSKGSLSAQDFTLIAGQKGSQLRLLNLSDDGQEFAGANITITAVRSGGNGDGFANVGYINATGVDLGKVTVKGDLGRIDAGDAALSTPGIRSLTVNSIGAFGTTTQDFLDASTQSTIAGSLAKLVVKTDLNRATISADSTGSIFIGRNVIGSDAGSGGGIKTTGNIAAVKILGSILGGAAVNSGVVQAGGTMGNVFIGGSIIGGAGGTSGVLDSTGKMGAVTIKGNVIGGASNYSGNVHSDQGIASISIAGSLIGGTSVGIYSGTVYTTESGDIGRVTIGGNLVGSTSTFSGTVISSGKIASVTVGGSLLGGSVAQSGSIGASEGIGKVTIRGSAIGGAGAFSGSIFTFGGAIGNVTILGDLMTNGGIGGIHSNDTLGAVKIGGDLRGHVPGAVSISAQGGIDAATAKLAGGIRSVTIGGSVKNANILGGYNSSLAATNPDASIGAVKVGGDWIASSIAAGVTPSDGLFGNANDAKITEATPDAIIARIASIVIKGTAIGTPLSAGDHFGFVAEQIGSLKIGGVSYALTAGASSPSDIAGQFVGPTLDLRVREV